MDLNIVYEDEHILVINKEAGILMHPTSTVRDHTLANGVLHYYQETNQHYDFHPVHRWIRIPLALLSSQNICSTTCV